VLRVGVRRQPDINVIAGRREHEVEALIWNYHDDEVAGQTANIQLKVDDLPENTRRVLLEHFRVDEIHSNSYTAWKAMGSPQTLSAAAREQLQRQGQLEQVKSPEWIAVERALEVKFELPRESMSLIRVSW